MLGMVRTSADGQGGVWVESLGEKAGGAGILRVVPHPAVAVVIRLDADHRRSLATGVSVGAGIRSGIARLRNRGKVSV